MLTTFVRKPTRSKFKDGSVKRDSIPVRKRRVVFFFCFINAQMTSLKCFACLCLGGHFESIWNDGRFEMKMFRFVTFREDEYSLLAFAK